MNRWNDFAARFAVLTLCFSITALSHAADSRTFNVRDFGAVGDGTNLDTQAINSAIEACSKAGGGQVLFPPGCYLTGTVQLRSHINIYLSAGAILAGTTNLSLYQTPKLPDSMPESRWGKWLRGLIVGENLEDVTIGGPGVIDGRKVFDPTGEEKMRGPHTINFASCRHVIVRDLSIVDSANYAVFFQASDNIEFRNIRITGGWDGIHFRGSTNRWCHNINIVDCQLYTGDDSIAGSYWDNTVISGCIVNSSCNGIRLIGPAVRLTIDHCLFYGPGKQPHRSSGTRSNMLSGIILQPSGWGKMEGPVDQVLLSDNTMRDVASPVTIWNKPGSDIGRVTISGLTATGVYRSAFSAESWTAAPITNVILRNAQIEFSGGGKPITDAVKSPGVDVRPLPGWGIFAHNVETLTLEDVRLSLVQEDPRPVIAAEKVDQLNLDNVRFTRNPAVAPLMSTNVGKINLRDTDIKD